jgi:hypothetical protein
LDYLRDVSNSMVAVGGGTTFLESLRLIPQVEAAWAAERRAKAVVDKVDAEAPPLPSGATVIAVS